MVAYSYQRQFVGPLLGGTKAQTIRAPRKGRSRHAKPGEVIQHYVGMRTKFCRLIGTSICRRVVPVELLIAAPSTNGTSVVTVGDQGFWQQPDLDEFAVRDGFADWADMLAFWRKHHPGVWRFQGFLIGWDSIEVKSDG